MANDTNQVELGPYLRAEQVAQLTGYNVEYIRQLARAGKLPAGKLGRIWLFDADKIRHIIEQHTLNIASDTPTQTNE